MLEVWGEFACFTRPESKVERFSYPVMTPSAARAIFDSIYISYSPGPPTRAQFRWQVRRVEILSPIRYIDFTRNEVKKKMSTRRVIGWMNSAAAGKLEAEREMSFGHTQRQTVALQDVRYRLHAEAVLYDENVRDRRRIELVFERRASHGQCVRQPYLGCREFPAYFQLNSSTDPPITYSEEIGWMPYDVFDLSQPYTSSSKPSVSLFYAQIQNGVLEIPAYDSENVRKLGLSL